VKHLLPLLTVGLCAGLLAQGCAEGDTNSPGGNNGGTNNATNNATNNGTNNATNNGTNNATNNATNNGDPVAVCQAVCDNLATACPDAFRAAGCPDAAIAQLGPVCRAACDDATARPQILAAGNLSCEQVAPIAIASFEQLAAACATCEDACTADTTRCNADGDVETCATAGDGCLAWSVTTDCGADQTCDDTATDATCVDGCTDACAADATQCNADGDVETCAAGADGCLAWSVTTDCAADQTCTTTDAATTCVDNCADACADGAIRCGADDDVETCATAADGCLAWSISTDCAADQHCEAAGNTFECVAGCADVCTADATRCGLAGDVETCGTGAAGCLAWAVTADCTADQTCTTTGGASSCVDNCTDDCTANATQCGVSGDIEICIPAASGCLAWSVRTDCPADQHCEAAGDTFECVVGCSDVCAANATRCDASGDVETCATAASGCLAWSLTSDCTANQTCTTNGNTSSCVNNCTDACTAGATQCGASGDVETCSAAANGCLAWAVTADCTVDQTCTTNGNTSSCVDSCTDSCAAGTTRCSVDGDVESCTVATTGCLDWSVSTACDADQTCDATGAAATCVDTCTDVCTGGATRCGSNSDVETCSRAATGCFDWSVSTDCNVNQRCDDSGPNVLCVDGCVDVCASGATQCGPNGDVEHCGITIGGCRAWSVATNCTADQRCDDTGAPTCVNNCSDACTANATRCGADGDVETCTTAATGCLAWSVSTDCTGNQHCGAVDNALVCVDGCTDVCPANATRCGANGDVETCGTAATGCRAWSVTADCTNAQTCDSTGNPAVCVDNCVDTCTNGATQCGASGDVETCTRAATGCFDWAITTDCPADQHCDASGAPACVDNCTDACTANTSRCDMARNVEVCAMAPTGCLDWTPGDTCGDGQICLEGENAAS